MSSNTNLLTSSGQLGLDLNATWGRVRHIVPEYVAQPGDLDVHFERLSQHRQRLGRNRSVLQATVARKPLSQLCAVHVEAYVPLDDASALISIAENSPERTGAHSLDSMMDEVDAAVERVASSPPRPVVQRMHDLANDHDITFTGQVTDVDIDRLAALWKRTFGWTDAQLRGFVTSLAEQEKRPSADRQIWFVGARDSGGHLVGVAMAERLDMPGPNGTTVPIVESTEWAVMPGARRQGLMTVLVALLNAKVLRDFGTVQPHIFAECNYDASAYEVSLRAFMSIPERRLDGVVAPQIHVQNVGVNGKLRSFVRTVVVPTQATLKQASGLIRDCQQTL